MDRTSRKRPMRSISGSASILLAASGILADGSVAVRTAYFVSLCLANALRVRGRMPRMAGNMPALPTDAYSRVFVNSITLWHG